MSTHSHEVVTDVRGELPRFLEEFHRLLALTTKALRGWPGEVFDKPSTGQHELLTPEATLDALAYLISNPVEAMAVRCAKDWPVASVGKPPPNAPEATKPLGPSTRSLRPRGIEPRLPKPCDACAPYQARFKHLGRIFRGSGYGSCAPRGRALGWVLCSQRH